MSNYLLSLIEEFSQKASKLKSEEITEYFYSFFADHIKCIDESTISYINTRLAYYKNSNEISIEKNLNNINKIAPEDLPVGLMATMIKYQQKKVIYNYIE